MAKITKNFKKEIKDVDGEALKIKEDENENEVATLAHMAKIAILQDTEKTKALTGQEKFDRHLLAVKLSEYLSSDEDKIELTTSELKTIEDSIGEGFNIRWAGAALAVLNVAE